MKKTALSILAVISSLAVFMSCDTDYQFPDPETVPQYLIKIPVVSATATATNGYSMTGEITALNEEQTKYSIDFRFDANGIDLSKLTIDIEYCVRTILKDKAPEGATVLDLNGKPYTFIVNNVENDVEYTITASVIPCQEPVLRASATSGNQTEYADVDNANRTIKFFLTSSEFDISNMNVSIVWNQRAVLGENTFDNKVINLSSAYTMNVGDAINFHDYTITAEFLNVPELIPYQQINVIRVEGDAQMFSELEIATDSDRQNMKADYMFDGEYVTKYNGASAIKHHQMYWYMTADADIAAHGDFLIFDVGEAVTMAQAAVHPYKSYSEQDPGVYEIYAYKVSNTEAPTAFSATSSEWVKIIEGDDSACWDLIQQVIEDQSLIGTDSDPCTKQQIHGAIEGITIPSARYYAFVMAKNFYQLQAPYYTKKLGWNPTNRWHCCCLTELEVWRYRKG